MVKLQIKQCNGIVIRSVVFTCCQKSLAITVGGVGGGAGMVMITDPMHFCYLFPK